MLCSKKLNLKLENIHTRTLGAAYLKINHFSFAKTINNKLTNEAWENLCKKTSYTLHVLQGIRKFVTACKLKISIDCPF